MNSDEYLAIQCFFSGNIIRLVGDKIDTNWSFGLNKGGKFSGLEFADQPENGVVCLCFPNSLQNGQYELSIVDSFGKTINYHIENEISYVSEDNQTLNSAFIRRNNKKKILVSIGKRANLLRKKYQVSVKSTRVSFAKNQLNVAIKVKCKFPTEIKSIFFKLRTNQTFIDMRLVNNIGNKAVGTIEIYNYDWQQFYWDAYTKVKIEGEIFEVRISDMNLKTLLSLAYFPGLKERKFSNQHVLYPYVTNKGALSLNYRMQTPYECGRYLRNIYFSSVLYFLVGWIIKRKKIWLIHEKFSNSAQDNSFAFFKYCYENHPEKNVYYVITDSSPDRKNLFPYKDKTLSFMSVKHQLYLMAASLIVASESKGHGYAWRVNKGLPKIKLNQKRFVFLQHGVIGFKKLDSTFKANGLNHANLFVASSEFEKKLIADNLGYKNNEIAVTGLARWDYIDSHKSDKKSILYMPTWRTWLDEIGDDEFQNSHYFQEIVNLLTNKKWLDFLKKNDLVINFYIHPKFSKKIRLFKITEGKNINLIYFWEKTLQELIDAATLLITDYSSIAWDFYYIKKPVILYQFDQKEYEHKQGAYLEFDDLDFMPIALDITKLVSEMTIVLENDFSLNQEYIARSRNFFAFSDTNNSKRIFKEISTKVKEESITSAWKFKMKRSPLALFFWKKLSKFLIFK